jgi:plasmid stabilization system protein ParE
MTYLVIIQPQAERAIQNQARWLVEQSNSATIALKWVRSIRKKIDTLKSTPLRCPVDADSKAYGEEVRLLLHGKRHKQFRILFIVRGEVVYIVAIRHAAQRSITEELAEDSSEGEDIDLH